MLRSAVFAIVVLVVAACSAGAAPPTAAPSFGPTAAPTPTSVANASAAPTAPPAATPTSAPTSGTAAELCATDWTTSPGECGGEVGDQFLFLCPPGGRETAIYGTDTYTDDSSACVAAVHVGLITFDTGGSVTVELTPGLNAYVGSTRNGVESSSWTSWQTSFVFVDGTAVDPFAALLAHIPDSMRQGCYETGNFATGAIIGIWCVPDMADHAAYYQFDTVDNLRQAFLDDVDYWGEGADGDNCQVGPAQQLYEISGAPAGRLLCNDSSAAIAIWTREDLIIEASLQLLPASPFSDLYHLWQVAGPNP